MATREPALLPTESWHKQGMDVNTQLSTPLNDKWQYASEMPEFIEYFKSIGIQFPFIGDNLANFEWLLAFIIDDGYFPFFGILPRSAWFNYGNTPWFYRWLTCCRSLDDVFMRWFTAFICYIAQ